MSNPDGDEDMNSAQSHYIEVAQGDISHEKNLDSGRAFYGQHIDLLHCTTNLVASCLDYQISSLNFMSLSNFTTPNLSFRYTLPKETNSLKTIDQNYNF